MLRLDISNPLSFEEFQNLVEEKVNSLNDHSKDYSNDDIKLLQRCQEVLHHKHIYYRVTNTLTSSRTDVIKDNSFVRMLVYTICEIYGGVATTIQENVLIKIPCTDYLPENQGVPRHQHVSHSDYNGYEMCGCSFAPNEFLKHVDSDDDDYYDYDSNIKYAKVFRARKVGVSYHK
jgi:hypothetical protein